MPSNREKRKEAAERLANEMRRQLVVADQDVLFRRMVGKVGAPGEVAPNLTVTDKFARDETAVTDANTQTFGTVSVTDNLTVTPKSGITPSVAWKAGYLKVPNWMLFNLFPTLDPAEQVVYLRLYLYTHGFGRNPHLVNQQALANESQMNAKTFMRAMTRLQGRGLVERLNVKHTGGNHERGTLVRVNIPELAGAPEGAMVKKGVTDDLGVTDRKGDMKRIREERKGEKAPAAPIPFASPEQKEESRAELRYMAARLMERHKGEGYTIEALRADMLNALDAQGGSVDAATMEWILDPYRAALTGDW